MADTPYTRQWRDALAAPESHEVEQMLIRFWNILRQLPDLLNRDEQLLASETMATLRTTVIDMMLALNGIQRPAGTRHLNSYLSENQRIALERSLLALEVSAETWIGQAVALVVIYRWYAPQLVERHRLTYPSTLEAGTWQALCQGLPKWPAEITTD